MPWVFQSGEIGGGGGIRTHGTVAGTAVFKTAALNHSATPPWKAEVRRLKAERTFRPLLPSALCLLPSGQKIHVQCDLQPQAAVLPQLVEREIERHGHFLY